MIKYCDNAQVADDLAGTTQAEPNWWNDVLTAVRKKVRTLDYKTWFTRIRVHSYCPGQLVLTVPSEKFRNWFADHFEESLVSTIETVAGEITSIQYKVVQPDLFSQKRFHGPGRPGPGILPANANLYTFSTFVVGPSNQLAYSASIAVGNSPGTVYNPLFIYGGTGLGKTHLLHAIASQVSLRQPELRVLYITSETYVNHLMAAISSAKQVEQLETFRSRYRDECDVLLVDDIQFFANKERTQIEFFHTFNALHSAGKQIVFTSDRFPQEIPNIEERLRSRFESGLIVDIKPPELETRAAIVKRKGQLRGVFIPDEVALFIAEGVTDNVRELESCVAMLQLESHRLGKPVDLQMAQTGLRHFLKTRTKRVTVEQIQRAVAAKFGVSVQDLCSSKRTKSIAIPRHIAIYLCRTLTTLSLPELGRKFGGRDHSTILTSIRRIENLLTHDTSIRRAVEELENKFR